MCHRVFHMVSHSNGHEGLDVSIFIQPHARLLCFLCTNFLVATTPGGKRTYMDSPKWLGIAFEHLSDLSFFGMLNPRIQPAKQMASNPLGIGHHHRNMHANRSHIWNMIRIMQASACQPQSILVQKRLLQKKQCLIVATSAIVLMTSVADQANHREYLLTIQGGDYVY